MTVYRFLWSSLATVGSVCVLLSLQAVAQNFDPLPGPQRIVEARNDSPLVERTVDDTVVQVFQNQPPPADISLQPRIVHERYEVEERGSDGKVHRRAVSVPVMHGGASAVAPDPESQKLLAEEQALAQSVRQLASEAQKAASTGELSDAKAVLRQKLVQIFDLQQQRRNREIAKIEDRLAKLKETLKKRDTSKDSIVDRRLETLTGGVDKLGWEDTFGNPGNPYGPASSLLPQPVNEPPADVRPSFAYPPPRAVGPRTGVVPAYSVPELPVGPVATPPAPARAPAPPGAPAPPVAPAPAAAPPAPAPGR